MRARLIEDGGYAASDREQFFRSPAFLEAEEATHTLELGDRLGIPLIVRPIEGSDRRDAISPYGYPGGTEASDSPPDPGEIDWSEADLVSVFIRDRIGERATLAGGTVRSRVHVAEGGGGIRKRLREQIRRNERRGWTVRTKPGPETSAGERSAFETAYGETMSRAGAEERYLYESSYFERLLSAESSWLLLASPGRDADGAAGAIAVASDGYLHYYLGGTSDPALPDSPMKNLFAAMIALGDELGLPLNLGGGVSPGDSLDRFKRGFANASAAFRTHELVCDPPAYQDLSRSAGAPEGFFPAYRA
ncbi:MAG TPA: GNAT family N-acetyltransferase [Solirubrobacterales bacterium]|nr:GNAT family N-acetyltransferase [Solirubrobacterales bacterium]